MCGREATLPVDWVFPTPFCEEENNVSVGGRHAGRKATCIQEHKRSARFKSEVEFQMYKTVNPEYQSGVPSVVFQS